MKNTKNSKGFTPIIIAVVVVLIVAGAYYFGTMRNKPVSTPTPVASSNNLPSIPTNNWKNYTNEKYGFSFKYPSQFKIDATNGYPNPDPTTILLSLIITDPSTKVNHPVLEGKKVDRLVFGIAVAPSFSCNPDESDGCSTRESIKIGNNVFNYYHSLYGMSALYYYDINNLKVTVETKDLHNTDAAFKEILSTFKFTK